jgi:hypothetical protein
MSTIRAPSDPLARVGRGLGHPCVAARCGLTADVGCPDHPGWVGLTDGGGSPDRLWLKISDRCGVFDK